MYQIARDCAPLGVSSMQTTLCHAVQDDSLSLLAGDGKKEDHLSMSKPSEMSLTWLLHQSEKPVERIHSTIHPVWNISIMCKNGIAEMYFHILYMS